MLMLADEADAVDPTPAGVVGRAGGAVDRSGVGGGAVGGGLRRGDKLGLSHRPALSLARGVAESLRFGAAFCPMGAEGALLRARTPSPELAGEEAAGRMGAAGRAGATTVSTLRTAASTGGVLTVTASVTVPATWSTAGCAGATTLTAA